jgi:ABC-2 type transport system ATP-binding protein
VKAVELRDVSKWFGPKAAVNRVSFSVEQGQCYGLIGPNGAGKTTTFSMMCGYLFPTQGTLSILGADPTRPGALKRKVGVLPQDAILPPSYAVGTLLTYWARLSGLPQPEQEARTALEKVGLADSWRTAAGTLSHGMAKRVAMAQALMGDPPVVLLDEPTAGLDPKIAGTVRQVVREMRGKQTVIISSHNLHELEELCDATALIDKGQLVTAASMAEMTSQSSEFRVQLARGEVPFPELRALRGCVGASLERPGSLLVNYDASQVPEEEMITASVGLLIQRGVMILSVTRGRKLEDRVMQLT